MLLANPAGGRLGGVANSSMGACLGKPQGQQPYGAGYGNSQPGYTGGTPMGAQL